MVGSLGDGVPHVAGSRGRATCWRGGGEVPETEGLGRRVDINLTV